MSYIRSILSSVWRYEKQAKIPYNLYGDPKMKLPCIDCITFPICRIEYSNHLTLTVNYDPEELRQARRFLTRKCTLMRNWIHHIRTYGESYNALHDHFYFHLPLH